MKKVEKQRYECLRILWDKNIKVPDNHDKMMNLCMSSSIVGIAMEYLGYLDKYPDIKEYISSRGGVTGIEGDNILTFREKLESLVDDER